MKILMLAPQPFFEPRGTPFSILGRLRALSQLGHEVDLLTYHLGQNVTIPRVTIHRIPPVHFIKKVKTGPSMVKLFLDLLLWAKAFRMLRRTRYDLLHSHEEASFFGVVLGKIFRLPHIYDMHSSLPQQLANFERAQYRPFIPIFQWLERQVINSSAAIITICPALQEHVKTLNGHAPYEMIENVASEGDPGIVSEEILAEFLRAYSLYGKRIVLYAGTFEPYQGIDLLIASAARVVEQNQDVIFLFLGGNPDQVERYQKQVNKLGLAANFRLIGARPPAEVPVALRLAHVLVSPRINGTNTPLKIYSYLQSGKPIVATNSFTHRQVLNEDAAILVDAQPAAFAKGILLLLNDPSLALAFGDKALQLFRSQYSYQQFLDKTDRIVRMAAR